MKAFVLKSRILAVLGPTAVGAALGASGCNNDSDGAPPSGSTQTGSTGSGSTQTGGTGSGVTSCLTREEIVQSCEPPSAGCYIPYPGSCCYAEAGSPARWKIDGGSSCPDSISAGNVRLHGPPVAKDGGACCYTAETIMAVATARPFLVEGKALGAPVAARADWIEEKHDENLRLDAPTRSALAAAWLEDARLEHASIASFARFILELLAVGAPALLVADAERALADELKHTRLCFSLASRYAGENLGPGPLAVGGTLAASSLVDAAVSTVREGCIYETLGALRASAALEQATDAHVRATLTIIADDEARHAELAWRFVSWAIANGGSVVRSAIERTFCEVLATLSDEASPLDANDVPRRLRPIDTAAWRTHGRLSPSEELESRVSAVRDVIEPCWRVLGSAANPDIEPNGGVPSSHTR